MTIDEAKAEKRILETRLRAVKRIIRDFSPSKKPTVHKPLKANPKTKYAERVFHDQVFKLHGDRCYFCGGLGTQAMHVVHRGSKLGNKRFCSPLIAVPGCDACHDLETRNIIRFPLDIRQVATRAHNFYARVPLPIPAE